MTKLRECVVGATLACLWACGSPEEVTIDQFFRAARTNDSPTIAAMSAAAPPGAIESWRVVEISSRSTEAFTLPELLGQFEAVTKERDAVLEEGKEYFSAQQEPLERIILKQREDPEYKFRGSLGEIQAEWARLTEERREKERAFQELKRTVDRETRLAAKSVMRQVKIESFDGDVAVTEMLLSLKPQDGDAELPFKATLKKYDLADPETGRVEPARWIIVDIEGTTPEAQALASTRGRVGAPVSDADAADTSAKVADDEAAASSETSARRESTHVPRELNGLARVQIVTPVTKVEGDQVTSVVRVRNVSRDWITRFTVTEHWYDEQGNAMTGGTRTHEGRFMPGEIIEFELRTTKNPKFFQNQFEFAHENGDVQATVVRDFPPPS